MKGVEKVKSDEVNMSIWNKLKRGYNPMEEGVRWTEKYSDDLEAVWRKTPVFLQKCLVVIAVALLGTSLNGNLIFLICPKTIFFQS